MYLCSSLEEAEGNKETKDLNKMRKNTKTKEKFEIFYQKRTHLKLM